MKYFCCIILYFFSFNSIIGQKPVTPFLTSDQLDIDIMKFIPNRAVYKNLYYLEKQAEVSGYIFIHLDQTQMWTQPNLIVNWSREGIGATGFDIVTTDEHLAIKNRQMPSRGYPGGIILENHYYGNRADVLFTNPNNQPATDTMKFSYSKKKEEYAFNTVYSHQKKHKYSHNVIIWPYVIASIDWDKTPDIIMPGFSPLGIQEYYYRLTYRKDTIIHDEAGIKYKAFIVSGFRSDNLEKLRTSKVSDPIPRADYYISSKAPYYLGKEVYGLTPEGEKKMSYKEIFLSYDKLDYAYRTYLDEMLELSKEGLSDFDMPWVDKEEGK